MTLTIYSPDYDKDVYGGGLNGCVFLDGGKEENGRGAFINLQEALKFAVGVGLRLDSIEYMYREGDEQLFVKLPFSINGSAVGSNPTCQGSSPCGATNKN